MDWVRSHHLTADSHQAANTHGGQLTDPIYLFNTGKGSDLAFHSR